ncbi:hypothetical protein KIPB_012244, partial [Kipferlia bialata]
ASVLPRVSMLSLHTFSNICTLASQVLSMARARMGSQETDRYHATSCVQCSLLYLWVKGLTGGREVSDTFNAASASLVVNLCLSLSVLSTSVLGGSQG